MKLHKDIHTFKGINPVVTIGNFDGMHLGHQAIIKRVKELAILEKGESVLITLWPHPRMVLKRGHESLRFLTLLDEKIRLIEQSGIDHLIIIPFTKEFAQVSYQEFIRDILLEQIRTRHIVIGYNHHFGKDREGTYDSLKFMSSELGFHAEQYPVQLVDDMQVSSSDIRKLLSAGDIKKANRLLGYRYLMTGSVGEGKKIGRKIGFPTANVVLPDSTKLLPADGVYAVHVNSGPRQFEGMMNIGTKPTVNGESDKKTIEVHLFDFTGDLYGKEITISFVDRIRDEKKFSGLDELKTQLEKDKYEAHRIFNLEK